MTGKGSIGLPNRQKQTPPSLLDHREGPRIEVIQGCKAIISGGARPK